MIQKSFLFLMLCFVSLQVHAAVVPLNGLKVTIVPKHRDAEDELRIKSAWVNSQQNVIKISWYSLVKDFVEGATYPTYKIKAERGVIETEALTNQGQVVVPAFWGQGFIRLNQGLPLWVSPELLKLKGRQKRHLNLGFSGQSDYLQKFMPDEAYEKVSYFNTLYNQYFNESGVRPEIPVKKKTRKELDSFYRGFFFVEALAKTKAELFINDVKESVDARIFGNDYFQMVILDQEDNPLILQFGFVTKKIPGPFRRLFTEIGKLIEYRVSHVSY